MIVAVTPDGRVGSGLQSVCLRQRAPGMDSVLSIFKTSVDSSGCPLTKMQGWRTDAVEAFHHQLGGLP
jgi:hypothetical protein